MIVVMKRGATSEQIAHAIQRVEQLGLKAHPIYGTERTVIAASSKYMGGIISANPETRNTARPRGLTRHS